MQAHNLKPMRNLKFVAQYWRSELSDDFKNAWRYTNWMIKKLRESNDPDKDAKISNLIDLCWDKYPLF